MSNVILLNSNAKKEVLLACKRIIESTLLLIASDDCSDERFDLSRDARTIGDIYFGVGMYGTITDAEVDFIIERHDALELWNAEEFAGKESTFRNCLLGE